MSPTNRQIIKDLFQAWNDHNIHGILSFYSPDCEGKDVGLPTVQRGQQAIEQVVTEYLSAFPDIRFSQMDMVIQKNRTAISWVAEATHQGVLMKIPPTWRKVSVRGVTLLTFENGKVTRMESIWDVAGLLRDLGLLPDL